mgnify:CR=1 FL=1
MRKRCNLEHFYVLKTFFHVKHFSHVKHFYRYKNENETMHYTLNLIVVNESSMKYKVSVFFGIQIGRFLSVWQPETSCSQCDAENVNSRIRRIS